MPRKKSTQEEKELKKQRDRDFERLWEEWAKKDDRLAQLWHSQEHIRKRLDVSPLWTEVDTVGSEDFTEDDLREVKLSNYTLNRMATERFKELYEEGLFIPPRSWLDPITPCGNCGKPVTPLRHTYCCRKCYRKRYRPLPKKYKLLPMPS